MQAVCDDKAGTIRAQSQATDTPGTDFQNDETAGTALQNNAEKIRSDGLAGLHEQTANTAGRIRGVSNSTRYCPRENRERGSDVKAVRFT